jgi:hypothetical protein
MTRASASRLVRYLAAIGHRARVRRCRAAGHGLAFFIVVVRP